MMGGTLLFDFDGTLVDLNRSQAYKKVVETHGRAGADLELAQRLYNRDVELCKQGKYDRADVFKEYLVKFPQASAEKLCMDFWKEVGDVQRLKDDCHDTLKKLKTQGHMLACVTDSDGPGGNKFRRIAAADLDKYFERIFIGGENVPFQKGTIEYLEHVVKELGVNRGQCVMMGDKVEIDLRPAEEIGMHSILVINPTYGGDWDQKVERLSGLIPIIKRLAGGSAVD